MKGKTYLQITEPCHENWDAMAPVQQGRFCNSCCKQVVDFTMMSDSQILQLLSKAAGNTCGRFKANQLERPLLREVPYSLRPYKFFAAAFIPALVITGAAFSQDRLQGKVAIQTTQQSPALIKGDTVYTQINSKLKGRMILEDGSPAINAAITIKGTKTGVVTDEKGNFHLDKLTPGKKLNLQASFVGYKTKEITVDLAKQHEVNITLDELIVLGEVVSIGYYSIKLNDEFVNAEKINRKASICGQVVNAEGQPLPFANITLGKTGKSVTADDTGKFKLHSERTDKFAEIIASHAGYEPVSQRVLFNENDTAKVIVALTENKKLPDVLVSTYATSCTKVFMGGISAVRSVTTADTVKLMTSKVFKNAMFTVYPNPVVKGGEVQVRFKQAGNYTIHLFDNAGRLYQSHKVVAEVANAPVSMPVPANVVPGNYFLKAVNMHTKKQFANKIIIQ